MLGEINGDLGMSNKLEQIAVRLEPELRLKLQLAADQDRRSLASMIRKTLHEATLAPSIGANAGGAR